jgi:uncharacterized repeat protein (TIGR01451 family)
VPKRSRQHLLQPRRRRRGRQRAGSIGESDWSDNYAADWVRVERVANMQTQSKQITSSPTGQAGVDSVYRITYRNAGPSTVPNVVFNDVFTLPAGDAGFVLIKAGLAPSTPTAR